jgi:hypothetical protein
MSESLVFEKLSTMGLSGLAVMSMLVVLTLVKKVTTQPTKEWLLVFFTCLGMTMMCVFGAAWQHWMLLQQSQQLSATVDGQRAALAVAVSAFDSLEELTANQPVNMEPTSWPASAPEDIPEGAEEGAEEVAATSQSAPSAPMIIHEAREMALPFLTED